MDHECLFEDKEYIWVKIIWAIIISGALPIIGGLVIIYRGYINYNRRVVKMFKIESQAVYASDRRYNSGQRYEGHQKVKTPVIVEANEEQIRRAKSKSYGYFTAGIISLIFYAFILLT